MLRVAAKFSRLGCRPRIAFWVAALVLAVGHIISATAVLPAGASSPATSGASAQVVGLHQVSGLSPFPQSCGGTADYGQAFEPGAAVDPRNHSRVVVGWIQDQATDNAIGRTADAGGTWSSVPAPGIGPREQGLYVNGYDPWTAWGPDGRAYMTSGSNGKPTGLAGPLNPDPLDGSVMVNTSTDGGKTWSSPSIVARDQDDGFIIDKPMVATDPARAGVAYALWSRSDVSFVIGELGFSRTSNGGLTWSAPQFIIPPHSRAPPPTGAGASASSGGHPFIHRRHQTKGTNGPQGPLSRCTNAVKPFVPTIAANDAGSLAVTYYDNRNDYWVSTSTDGGGSWAETHIAGPRSPHNDQVCRPGMERWSR